MLLDIYLKNRVKKKGLCSPFLLTFECFYVIITTVKKGSESMAENAMKNVFLSRTRESAEKMFHYIHDDLGIESDLYNYLGYMVIEVASQEYERALLEGKKYAIQEDFGMFWIDQYNVRRSPIGSVDIGLGILPGTRLPGETKKAYHNRIMMSIDEYTPKIVLDYFKAMEKYLGVEVFRSYDTGDDAIIISPSGIDHEKYSDLLQEFVREYGTGPFDMIYPLTFTGKLVEEPLQKVKK